MGPAIRRRQQVEGPLKAAAAGCRYRQEALVEAATDRLGHPACAVADTVDRAYDGVAALDQLLDAVQAVFDAAVVVKNGGYACFSRRSQVGQQACTPADIEKAMLPQGLGISCWCSPCNGGIDAATMRALCLESRAEARNGGFGCTGRRPPCHRSARCSWPAPAHADRRRHRDDAWWTGDGRHRRFDGPSGRRPDMAAPCRAFPATRSGRKAAACRCGRTLESTRCGQGTAARRAAERKLAV